MPESHNQHESGLRFDDFGPDLCISLWITQDVVAVVDLDFLRCARNVRLGYGLRNHLGVNL